MKPKLTKTRKNALAKIAKLPDRPFLASDIGVHGMSLYSLERCGWLEKSDPDPDEPFLADTNGHYWRLTDAGRQAIIIVCTQQEINA